MRILKIESLPSFEDESHIDADHIMLHACFQLLVNFIEGENPDEICDFSQSPNKETWGEVYSLYQWWIGRRDKDLHKDEDLKTDDENLMRLMKVRTFLWT